jgi:hypothetical protein
MKTIKTHILILGAGIGGLGSACWAKELKQKFIVVESNEELPMNLQNGVHYLHSIPELPFETRTKSITLTDGIMDEKGDIRHNWTLDDVLEYSEKVREIQHPTSIMDIGKRNFVFMPESNCMNDLLKEMYEFSGRENYRFGQPIRKIDIDKKIAYTDNIGVKYDYLISTLPLDFFEIFFGLKNKYKSSPISITNFEVDKIVPNWLINIYIPSQRTSIYRFSILNGIVSIESSGGFANNRDINFFLKKFSLVKDTKKEFEWKTGKVVSIDREERAELIDIFAAFDCFSIGRFGLHNRKLLMDNTIKQAKSIVEHISDSSIPWQETRKELL